MKVAVFRPDDDRLARAVSLLDSLGVEPVPDPMLAVEATGTAPREDSDYTVVTSKTGVELAAEAGWEPSGTVCAIGDATAAALRAAGYPVDLVPEEFSSVGLVAALEDRVAGARCEVARSNHGSPVLTNGLERAGAYVHETVLYELVTPPGAGESATLAAAGDLDGAVFTSSLTVENFLAAADERGVRAAAVAGLEECVVGTIGEPTRATAEREGIPVDVVPETADFEVLARAVVERLSN
ncbi:uroporphyrinogen-III synthase [Halococcus hamelinensis]|uniref:Uroporphyrinogen-III synthase n=2 Tax=Halococcus hamelinensis TaxID=332168 RepID=M0LUZ4_9EURY|nr:uroporphyrinogen-III synthase [Halococcus hamelinensis]EMA36199.1 uroporphyrinogen-III synthase [Halococcus hamelinensis 100A6]